MSIILLGPIEVDPGDFRCVKDSEPYKHFTTPVFGTDTSTSPRIGPKAEGTILTGNNVFNIYQALGNTDPDYPANQFRDDPRKSGSIKFGVTPCAKKIDIQVYGRADTYGKGFDTLNIIIDGVLKKNFQSNGNNAGESAPFSKTVTFDETVSHTFDEPEVCGHLVEISGQSGSFANNNVGYDVKVTVTLR